MYVSNSHIIRFIEMEKVPPHGTFLFIKEPDFTSAAKASNCEQLDVHYRLINFFKKCLREELL